MRERERKRERKKGIRFSPFTINEIIRKFYTMRKTCQLIVFINMFIRLTLINFDRFTPVR